MGPKHDPEKHALGPRPDGRVPVFPPDKRLSGAGRFQMAGARLRLGRPGPLRPRRGRVTPTCKRRRPHMAGGSFAEDHYAAPRSRLTNIYLSGYTSINSQQVIDPKFRTLTMCSSERS